VSAVAADPADVADAADATDATARPELAELALADAPGAWEALGFSVENDAVSLGGMRLTLGAEGRGIVSWTLRGVAGVEAIDGLPTRVEDTAAPAAVEHPNGVVGVDHVVVVTNELDRTIGALAALGMPPRRIRQAGEVRQAFRRLGPAILEVVESPRVPPGPARFWGLTLVAADLGAFVSRLGPERISEPHDAVQPGRRIATLRREAGLSLPLAVMDI
jgi:hypothetical protein